MALKTKTKPTKETVDIDEVDDNIDATQYQPDEDDQKLIRLVEDNFSKGKRTRQQYEGQWYTTTAFLNGQQWTQWDGTTQSLVTPPAPSYRVRRTFNLMLPKHRARMAKFTKSRPRPEVRPATQDIQDILNARMTTKAISYSWRHLELEHKYQDAIEWAGRCGHGYWWIYWDPTPFARVRYKDQQTNKSTIGEAQLGDVAVEVGSSFELLVADGTISYIGDQPWIMRTKVRSLDWIKANHEDGKFVTAEGESEASQDYVKAIGSLPPTVSSYNSQVSVGKGSEPKTNGALVKEYFEHPNGKFPKGRYLVVANGVLLKDQQKLPYEMWDMANPYPCVDYRDSSFSGQYWSPTINEQAISPQRQYNLLRSKFEENIKGMVFPKLLVAKQHQIPPGAWTGDANEIVTYVAHAGIPPPQTWTPENIASDVWRALEVLRGEIDSIYHIYPESEGKVGQSTSGFQTNLLQEATDAVHGPDIRNHERSLEEAALKIRRLMKLMYGVERLLSITSQEDQVDAFEFSSEQIDDHADIVVQVGSGLPDLKGARIQMALELRTSGIFGDPADPEVNRRVLNMIDIGDLSAVYADARRDEERARLENVGFANSTVPKIPLFCDNHMIHSRVHTDQLKSSEFDRWDEQIQGSFIDHILWHSVYINPAAAAQIAAIYGRQVPMLPQPPMTAAPPGGPGQGQPPPNPNGPPQPQGGPPPEQMNQAMSGNQGLPQQTGFGPQGTNATLTA